MEKIDFKGLVEQILLDFWGVREQYRDEWGRQQRSFTIGKHNDIAWRDFVTTISGTEIRPGNGINSVMVEFAMALTMALVTGFKIEELAVAIKEMMPSDFAQDKVKKQLAQLLELL